MGGHNTSSLSHIRAWRDTSRGHYWPLEERDPANTHFLGNISVQRTAFREILNFDSNWRFIVVKWQYLFCFTRTTSGHELATGQCQFDNNVKTQNNESDRSEYPPSFVLDQSSHRLSIGCSMHLHIQIILGLSIQWFHVIYYKFCEVNSFTTLFIE